MMTNIKEFQKLSCGCEQHVQEGGSPSTLATYLESHGADLGKSLLPLSLRKGLCCLSLLSASTLCLFPFLHTPRHPLKLLIFGRTVGLPLKADQCNNQLRVQEPPKVPGLS